MSVRKPIPSGNRSTARGQAGAVADVAPREWEVNFRAFFRTIREAAVVATAEGRILFANEVFAEMTGYGPEEQSRIHLLDIHPAERRAEAEQVFAEMCRGERSTCPLPLQRRTGELVPVETRAWMGEWNGVQAIFGLIRDMSVEVEGRERFEAVFHANPAPMALTYVEGEFIDVNEAFLSLLGYARDEVMGQDATGLGLFPKPEQQVAAGIQLRDTGRIDNVPLQVRRKDGRILEGLFSGLTLRAGNQTYFLTVMMDVTEQRRMNEALLNSEGRARALLSAIPDMIFRMSRDGVFIDYKAEDSSLLYADIAKGIIGRNIVDLLPPELAERTLGKAREVLDSGQLSVFEYVLPARDGDPHEFEARMVVNGPGEVTAVVRDITERKRAEGERARLEQQLRLAQKMESVGRLAGGVAHDFNNMLCVILGRVEIALLRVDDADPLRDDLEEIRTAATRSANLTRQLLTFARRQLMEARVLDLNEITSDILRMLQRLVGENVTVSLEQAPGLWQVRTDPSLIDQILTNLCANARDAIADTGRITIATANVDLDADFCALHPECTPGDHVRLSVTDDGHGMDTETLGSIFEPFFTTKDVGEGNGLGLATVYGAVRQSDGCITVESAPGRGSTFDVYLPRWQGAGVESHGAEEEAAPVEGRTILLVEDEAALMKMCSVALSRHGHRILEARTPREAMLIAAEHDGEIDLLVTDVILPEMNGRDLARELTITRPALKVLYMSGYTASVIGRHGVLEPGEHFLQKPFQIGTLRKKVNEALAPA